MLYDLPKDVLQGLRQARRRDLARRNRLCVRSGDQVFRIARFWETGFALDAQTTMHLRGHVDIYDGPRHLYQCLVVYASREGGERVYTFKRLTAVAETAPLDYSRDEGSPVALLT
ncbi:MAG: hypothetical protein ACE5DK_02510 [Paracoccaceae bacterium]